MTFSEDDDIIERSVDVVLFHAANDGWVIPVGGGVPLTLTGTDQLDEDILAALRDATIALTTPGDVPAAVAQALIDGPAPPLFGRSPWLREHRALVFTDGHCVVGDCVLRYQDELGVYMGEPALELAPDQPISFDLLSQPWVPVVGLDGKPGFVGLESLILGAHEIRRIVTEAPTMTAALYRLVIALIHRVYGPPSELAWRDLWSASEFSSRALQSYLDQHRDRFDLFHEQQPFMQCAELASVRPSTPGKLVPYRAVGNNVTLFDHTTSTDRILLSPAEAARWLVTTHAFDPGGMKTPFENDKSSERAPCNWFGVVLVEGATLKETLLLNTCVYEPEYEKPARTTPDDRPVWEAVTAPPPTPDKRVTMGWTDLLTWPSRRVLLCTQRSSVGVMVDGVVLTPGTRLDSSLPDEERMVAFRRPRNAKGKPKPDAPMLPVRLRPGRGIWRHSVELLLVDLWEEGRSRQRPSVLDQIAELAEKRYLPPDTVYTLRVFGQQLDSKASVVEAWLEEEIPAPVALLRAHDDSLGGLIGCAIALADDVGSALRALQANYRRELRADPVSNIDLSYWSQLPRPFDSFLRRLGEARVQGRSEARAAHDWGRTVSGIATSVAERWVAGSPAEASKMVVLGKHYGQFQSRLATAGRLFQNQTAAYSTGEEE